jgi:anti-sigma B factor antagonist
VFLAEAVSPHLSVSWERASQLSAVLRLQGELELDTVQFLQRECERLAALDAPRVILDLNQVSFIDSAGMGALVAFYKRSHGRKELCLALRSGSCRRWLDRVQLTRYLATYDTVEDALATEK